MSNHLFFEPSSNHSELFKLLESFDVSLETYQLGQLLTRALLYPKNGDLGGWWTYGGTGENRFSQNCLKITWKQKLELAFKTIEKWPESPIRVSDEFRKNMTYGSETIRPSKGELFDSSVRLFEKYIDVLKLKEKVETGGFKLLTKGQYIREREEMAGNIKKFLSFDAKKFVRTSMIEYNHETETFVYHPENHPYFREWLLYNLAFWSPFFKSRTIIGKKIRKLETVRSNELIPFLAKKFKIEHWTKDEANQKMIETFYNEKSIGDLVDNSFFRKDRLESIYKGGILDKYIIAYIIQTREPLTEYSNATIDELCLEAAESLVSPKKEKAKKAA